ncbi:MAG TPA: enoyl-CoA hydratase-related protein [Actinomycetes bacterium]|nr:enoyl-CoA hydratase-related protein [Actinomycetes bacterium]
MSSSSSSSTTYAVSGEVATITLARPDKRNAFDAVMLRALGHHAEAASNDPAVRVVVVAAEGTSFCAGADLGASKKEDAGAAASALSELLDHWSKLPKPLVARVQGPVMGGGNGLLAVCDLVVASATATFAFREVRVGVVPAVIAVPLMLRLAPGCVRDVMLTGRTFDADYACLIGLVHRVVPPDRLDAALAEVVDALTLGAPTAQAETKALLRELAGMSQSDQFARATQVSLERFGSDEAREGMQAFREKRRPRW